jgi:hypothetical protein
MGADAVAGRSHGVKRLTLAAIVEGQGEVEAVPVLLRRVAAELDPYLALTVPKPIRLPRTKFPIKYELERAVQLAKLDAGPDGAILILADADDDCPAVLGPKLLDHAQSVAPDHKVSVVLAMYEYEAWFLASAESLRGRRGLPANLTRPSDPEAIRAAKGWLSHQMPAGRKYSETTDQAALSQCFDLTAARTASSFDKFYREITWLLSPHSGE